MFDGEIPPLFLVRGGVFDAEFRLLARRSARPLGRLPVQCLLGGHDRASVRMLPRHFQPMLVSFFHLSISMTEGRGGHAQPPSGSFRDFPDEPGTAAQVDLQRVGGRRLDAANSAVSRAPTRSVVCVPEAFRTYGKGPPSRVYPMQKPRYRFDRNPYAGPTGWTADKKERSRKKAPSHVTVSALHLMDKEPPAANRQTVELWDAVGRVLDGSTAAGASMHGLGPLLARRLRHRGRPVPETLEAESRTSSLAMLVCRPLLQRVRESCDGPLVLMKGPEIAQLYPDAARPFGDLDLLVPDAPAAHRQLKAAGFVEVGEPELFWGIHHLHPLQWPLLPMRIELHTRPKWARGLDEPPSAQMIDEAVPCHLDVDGVSVLSPIHHALVVAMHHWAHVPLARCRDMVDVVALSGQSTEAELEQAAAAWGMRRLWLTSLHAAKATLGLESPTTPLRVWARHLPDVRERSVLEKHLQLWLSAYWSLSPAQAVRASGRALLKDLRPAFDEGWRDKGARFVKAVRRARVPLSVHDEQLGEAARRGQGRNPPPAEE